MSDDVMSSTLKPCRMASANSSLDTRTTPSQEMLHSTKGSIAPWLIEEENDDISFYATPPPCTGDVNPHDADTFIAQEMTALSLKDREKVLCDIHGVSVLPVETAECIQKALQEMDSELSKLENCPAYELAMQMDPDYTRDESFRLKFLRADCFNAELAAARMGRHFQMKLDLFGPDSLVKDITQDDFNRETRRVATLGHMQILASRDTGGRTILTEILQPTDMAVIGKLHFAYYMIMAAVEDEETQRRGCVAISYLVGRKCWRRDNFQHWSEWSFKLAQLFQSMPIRFNGIHICHNSLTWTLILNFFKLAASVSDRVRTREHYGNRSECLLSLQTFGIPASDYPVDANGNVVKEQHLRWLELRKALEYQRTYSPCSEVLSYEMISPDRVDVMLGRGRAYYEHSGNVRLRTIIEKCSPEYEKANRSEKLKISEKVVSKIKKSGGRFLAESGGRWNVVPDKVARKKVAHAFRSLRGIKRSTISFEEEQLLVASKKTGISVHRMKRPNSGS